MVIPRKKDATSMDEKPKLLEVGEETIAYYHTEGSLPGILWLGGFMSDMCGGKATELHHFAQSEGWQFTRFDYGGHGQSSGRFEDGTIGLWLSHALAVFDTVTSGPQILVGSSMGGWVMLLIALARPERVQALVGMASAPDFTEDLMWAAFSEAQQREMAELNRIMLPNCMAGEADYPITRTLIEEGRTHRVMTGDSINITCPVHLIHGMKDPDVPWQLSVSLAEKLAHDDVAITLLKDGDHRLSTPDNLATLKQVVKQMRKKVSAPS